MSEIKVPIKDFKKEPTREEQLNILVTAEEILNELHRETLQYHEYSVLMDAVIIGIELLKEIEEGRLVPGKQNLIKWECCNCGERHDEYPPNDVCKRCRREGDFVQILVDEDGNFIREVE